MRPTRRNLLIGGVAVAAAWPLRGMAAPSDADARVRATLDGLSALPTPMAKLARIETVPTHGLSRGALLDLETARQGLAVDVRLAALFPDTVPGRLPAGVGAAGASPGVWQLPKGRDFYALLLERQVGEPVDVPQVHARLMGEWKRLAGQADRLLAGQGFREGTVGDRFRAMFRDPRWHYADTSAGRDRAVAEMNAVLDRAAARVPDLIGAVPSYCLAVRARRMSPADEAAGKGGYRIVAGPTTPGIYFVDLADIARRPSWSLGSVVHHELLSGHMIQMPIEAAADPHPLRLQYAPAFTEGWAIYAEKLAVENGGFDGDAPQMLGYLHWALFRIGRAIADTGIHHAHWSRAQALAMLHETQGEPAYFAPFESDVDRICRAPGNRAAEALTWLRLDDLRRDATGKAGGAATLRRFHQTVLADGRKRLTTIEAELRHRPR